MNKKTAEYIKTLIADTEYHLKSERMSFDNDCKRLKRNPQDYVYFKESNEELALIKDAYSSLNYDNKTKLILITLLETLVTSL